MTVNEQALLKSNDAAVWAAEFCRIIRKNEGVNLDESWVIGWFANAMVNQYDRGRREGPGKSVLQSWVFDLSIMQQTVLIEIVRGPDGLTKYHVSKFLLRWYRRCLVTSAFEGRVLTNPWEGGGGSFTGPSISDDRAHEMFDEAGNGGDPNWEKPMLEILNEVIRSADEMPHHFYRHMMHGFEIMGYKHPDERIRTFWHLCYRRLSMDMHLHMETAEELDVRLGDTREGWLKSADEATLA